MIPRVNRNQSSRKNSEASLLRSSGPRRVSAAAAYSQGLRSSEPSVTGTFRSTNIKHRELVSSINGTSAFTVSQSLALNPGISATFPWLSSQAVGWEQYRFNSLRFCYYTRCATTTTGSLLLVPDYDAADSAPSSEQIASAYRDVVEEVPWVPNFVCTLDPKAMSSLLGRKYIRTGPLAANLDIKTYDSGNLFVCTLDGTVTNWGKLWVEYDVDFFVPQLPPTGLSSLITSERIDGGLSVSKSAIFGTAPTLAGSQMATALSQTLTFILPGEYLVNLTLSGTGLTLVSPAITGTSTTTQVVASCVDAGGVLLSGTFLVVTTAPNQTTVLNYTALSGSVTGSTTRITEYTSTLG